MLKAVIFDMDGVLVNSETMHYEAWKKAVAEFGFDYPYEHYRPFIGSTNEKLMEHLRSCCEIPISDAELLARVLDNKQYFIKKNGFERTPGIPEFLKSLKENGMLLAVASSSPHDYIIQVTKGIGIYSLFDLIVSGESVKHPKPAPDVFLKTAEALGVPPSECLIVEDSENGVCAADTAGMASIGYLNPDSGDQDLSKAAILVEGFEELDYEFAKKAYERHHHFP